MICLDCGSTDIRYDDEEKSYYCNNCGSRNLGNKKDGCRYMNDGLCKKDITISGECEAPCDYYKK